MEKFSCRSRRAFERRQRYGGGKERGSTLLSFQEGKDLPNRHLDSPHRAFHMENWCTYSDGILDLARSETRRKVW
jgi:hypothetical protein